MRSLFLSLEGVDGAGKTTQISTLVEWLRQMGHKVLVVREPGGTALGEELRRILLDNRSQVAMTAEMLLYMASRAQLVDDVIRPALESGTIVVADRFLLSTIVYQGHAGGVDAESIRQVGKIATRGTLPDWIGVLDVSWETSVARRQGPADRIESRGRDFFEKVRSGFRVEADRDHQSISIIDAQAEPDLVQAQIRKEVSRVLASTGRS